MANDQSMDGTLMDLTLNPQPPYRGAAKAPLGFPLNARPQLHAEVFLRYGVGRLKPWRQREPNDEIRSMGGKQRCSLQMQFEEGTALMADHASKQKKGQRSKSTKTKSYQSMLERLPA